MAFPYNVTCYPSTAFIFILKFEISYIDVIG